ncbi:hypothetical protein D6C93_00579 [Aureobasidium pullulans]|nr:hypothetical protein D6C93_00579 [Aureobasidium pullulans]
MRAVLSFTIAAALANYVNAWALMPRQTSGASSTPPSTAITNVTCNGKSAYNYAAMTSVPANASCTTQTFYINTKSNCTTKSFLIDTRTSSSCNCSTSSAPQNTTSCTPLPCLYELDIFVNNIVNSLFVDFFIFFNSLFDKFFIFVHSLFNEFLDFIDTMFHDLLISVNSLLDFSIFAHPNLDDFDSSHQFHGRGRLSKHSVLCHLWQERPDYCYIFVQHRSGYTSTDSDYLVCFLQWWQHQYLVPRYIY